MILKNHYLADSVLCIKLAYLFDNKWWDFVDFENKLFDSEKYD